MRERALGENMVVLAFGWPPDRLDAMTASELEHRWLPLARLALKRQPRMVVF